MRATGWALVLLALCGTARAEDVDLVLGDGFTARFPAQPERTRVVDRRPDGREVPLDAWNLAHGTAAFSALSGLVPEALQGDAAEADLRRRVNQTLARFEKDGQTKLMGIRRSDVGDAVGIEAKISVLRQGRVVRFISRLLLRGRRFVQVAYCSAKDDYDAAAAKRFLDSLGATRQEVAEAAVGDNGRMVGKASGKDNSESPKLGEADLTEVRAALEAYRADRSQRSFDRAFQAMRRCYVVDFEMARQAAFFGRYADLIHEQVRAAPWLDQTPLKTYFAYLAEDLQDTEVPALIEKGKRLQALLGGR